MSTPRETFFDVNEYENRLKQVKKQLVINDIDLLITFSPGNICYLNGYVSVNVLDIMFMAIPLDGDPIFYLWQFEKGRAQSTVVGMETVCWDTGDNPIEFVVSQLKGRGHNKGVMAIDTGSTHTSFDTVDQLLTALNGITKKGIIEKVRLIKSKSEKEYIRKAAKITDAGVLAAIKEIEEGKTDYKVGQAAIFALYKAESEFLALEPIICVGWRSGAPHSPRGGTIVGPVDPVFIELSGVRGRYHSPLMRTVTQNKPKDEILDLAKYSNDCVETIIETIGPGIPANEIAEAGKLALKPIRNKIAFHDLYAYPVGIGFPPNWIENPEFYLSANNSNQIESGMVFHLPLTLRVLGEYGAGFSETIIINDNGIEIMSKLPRSIEKNSYL